ncbi:hypothetical protein MCHUDSM44219_00392 [Mycolicibacterium chubuense]|uniref:DUF732 domain-containing protein n=2 Tax=Mycolicibacterium chubuense TaxID=1800 RepID=A0A0J6WRI8_MYCCU|nr:hypothetical protein MCHUDSM44219_00392 [Mycolicibacterium chubuense]SPY00830.1 Uncharacterised protein [Mycolicibacterium chubuense]
MMVIAVLAALTVGLGVAAHAQADCRESEFDWAATYVGALQNHDLGYLVDGRGIPVALAAEAVCKGSSAHGIADEYDFGLATAEQIARAVNLHVCPEMAQ